MVFSQLRLGYYSESCPQADSLIGNMVHQRFGTDPTVTAALLINHSQSYMPSGLSSNKIKSQVVLTRNSKSLFQYINIEYMKKIKLFF